MAVGKLKGTAGATWTGRSPPPSSPSSFTSTTFSAKQRRAPCHRGSQYPPRFPRTHYRRHHLRSRQDAELPRLRRVPHHALDLDGICDLLILMVLGVFANASYIMSRSCARRRASTTPVPTVPSASWAPSPEGPCHPVLSNVHQARYRGGNDLSETPPDPSSMNFTSPSSSRPRSPSSKRRQYEEGVYRLCSCSCSCFRIFLLTVPRAYRTRLRPCSCPSVHSLIRTSSIVKNIRLNEIQ